MIYRTSNKYAKDYVRQRKEFKGSNLFAKHVNNFYVVYSYGEHFPIYAYDKQKQVWYKNRDKYSVSTSRHQSQCGTYIGTFVELTTEEIKSLIRK